VKQKRVKKRHKISSVVLKFKMGDRKQFPIIYRYCIGALDYISFRINFSNLKTSRDDFIQDSLIFIFCHLIKKFDSDHSLNFPGYLYKSLKYFAIRYTKSQKRKEYLIESDSLSSDDEIDSILLFLNEKRKKTNYDFASMPEIFDLFRKFVKLLSKKDKKIIKELWNRRYLNNTESGKIMIAMKCDLSSRQIYFKIKELEEKMLGVMNESEGVYR